MAKGHQTPSTQNKHTFPNTPTMVKRTTVTTTAIATTATTTTPIKKKKGRPSLLDLQNRALLQQHQQQQNQNPNNSINNNNSQSNTNNNNNNRRVRSTRRILNLPAHFLDGSDSDDDILSGRNSIGSEPSDYDDDDDDHDDDDDERVQKKVKLVVQFPNKNAVISQKHQKNEKRSKATDNILNGTRRMLGGLEHGPTTTSTSTTTPSSSTTRLPDKKLLLLLLDKLQKKDTRGVFAEPVDPEELPDYHEIIENPMDFETVRKKLIGGVYTILEQLEDDVNLICSNAMQYNAPSTIFFRQARAIQELAKKEFEVLKQDGGLIEAPNKPRRGRPPGSKNLKKILESSLPEHSATVCESSPDATPASQEDPTKSGSYNLRKGPSLYRFPRSFDHSFNYSGFSASSSKWMSSKYGKKTFGSDENTRDTYFLSSEPNSSQDPHSLGTFGEKELTAQVGLALDHSYSRSLARFAADLGPAVSKIISKKITSVLPPGVEFGPGWVGEPKLSSTQSNFVSQDFFQSEPHQPMASGFPRANFAANLPASCREKPVEPREFSSNVEWSSLKGVNNDNGVVGPGLSVHFQHLNSVHRRMNGVSGSFGSSTQLHDAIARPTSSQSASLYNNPFALDSSTPFDASRNFNGMISSESDLVTQGQGMPYWQNLSIQERWDHPYPVELNRGFQASSSKNSNLPIGSPPQLDLVLQL